MIKSQIMKPLGVVLTIIVVSYSIYSLYDILSRKQGKLDNDLCMNDKYFETFQDPKKRKKLGLPDVYFSNYSMKPNRNNSSMIYTSTNNSKLKKIIYYCFSGSEEDVYILNDGNKLKVQFYFENKTVRFSLEKNGDKLYFIEKNEAINLLRKNKLTMSYN